MSRYNYVALMKHLKSLEEIVKIGNEYCGLLKNHPNAADGFYEQSHGDLTIKISQAPYATNPAERHQATLMIDSIDDGLIVLLGPIETREKAEQRERMLRSVAKSWGGWIPNAEQVDAAAKETGCYWNR